MSLLVTVEENLKNALKQKDELTVSVLRSLKTRLVNEKIATGELSMQKELDLVKSEVKRRNEAAIAFANANNEEKAQQEKQEAEILLTYLPEQLSKEQIVEKVSEFLTNNTYTASDMGLVIKSVKELLGNAADGGSIAAVVKDLLK